MAALKKILVTAVLTAALGGPLHAASGGAPRLVPLGSVVILETGVVLDREIPAPPGMLMACKGRCYVESPGMLLSTADGTVFAIREENDRHSVAIQKGSLDFTLSDGAKPLEFRTPFDTVKASPYLVPAGNEAVVRGTLQVTENKATLSVSQGSLQIANPKRHENLLHAGNAVNMPQPTPKSPYTAGSGKTSTDMRETLSGWVIGAASLGIIGASIGALASGGDGGGGGGDDGDEVSKFQ